MAKAVSKSDTATALRLLIVAAVIFILMVVFVPLLNVSAAAVAAENGWYKFHTFFADLQTHFSDNALLYLFFVVVIIGAVYLYRKYLNKR